MKTMICAGRVTKEILRDPLSIVFGIGFPIVLLLLLHMIQQNVPVEMFVLEELTPGICVFGLSFLSLFSAQLVARDRATSMLSRMFTAPVRAGDFILGYTLPLLPMGLAQGVICYAVAWILGLPLTPSVILALLSLLPVSCIYIGIGLLCGSLLSEKAATSICGALLTNLSAWLSGTWFSLELVGDAFSTFAKLFPFSHAVDLGRSVLQGNGEAVWEHLAFVGGYAIFLLFLAVVAFRRTMKA